MKCYKSDTPKRVCFYEQEFYCLSNFSSFEVEINGARAPTVEHAYHVLKFEDPTIQHFILDARSAHDAFKYAQALKEFVRPDWNDVKVEFMKELLITKVEQHPYVYKKLMETGDRELVEDSWRDSFWGWGEDHNGQNQLGKLWMEIRTSLRNN